MRKFYKPLALLLICAAVISLAPNIESTQAAPVNANIVINNRPYLPQNAIENINSRMLLPFREISEAIGAVVDWQESSQRILTTYGSRYSIMYINNANVTYGTYTLDSNGSMVFSNDTMTMTMDVVPQLVGSLTYIPLRAFAQTLGAVVDWVEPTSTAYIDIEPAATPTETVPTASPTPSTAANYDDFSNTSYFRIIASDAVKSMYQDSNNRPFVFVLYDSSLESSKQIVPNLQDAAQSVRYRIYGVDMNDSSNRARDNEWLWDFFRENNFEDPTLYLVYSKSKVEQMVAPKDMNAVETALTKFSTQAESEYEYGDFANTTYFNSKADTAIQRDIDNRKEFILVLYDRTDDDSKYYVPLIKAAAKEKKVEVVGLDIDRYPRFYNNVEFLDKYRYDDLPIMFLVYRDLEDLQSYKQPSSVERAKSYIDEFENKKSSSGSKYADIKDSYGYYTNANITNLRQRYNNNEEFVIFIYDSSDSYYEAMVEDFVYYAENDSTVRNKYSTIRLYGVNKSSTEYDDNHVASNYRWIDDINSYIDVTYPIVVHVKNGITKLDPVNSTSYNRALNAVRNYMSN